MKLYIFTEESSMKKCLIEILKRLNIPHNRFQIIAYDGVGDLMRSLQPQMESLDTDGARFLICRDADNKNCHDLKAIILEMARKAGRQNKTKVRIVCQMLESWFIGDPPALVRSKCVGSSLPNRLKTCNPDMLTDPKKDLERLARRHGKCFSPNKAAQAIAPHLSLEQNRSRSFINTVKAIRALT